MKYTDFINHRIKRFFYLFILLNSIVFANSLQTAINNAKPYSTLKLSSGVYTNKIIINKPITIIGAKNTIIKGDNIGTVITINSSNVVLKNLSIINSGKRLEMLDSAIFINNSNNCKIDNCRIKDSLYGINMKMVNNTTISNNHISSLNLPISLKGNSLKLWYCNNNIIKNNTISNTRDFVLTRSNNNKIQNNNIVNNRFAIHIELSKNNQIKNNNIKQNSVGILLMGAKNTKILNNKILSSKGAAGIGVMIKGVKNLLFEKNIVSYNAQGIYIDSASKEKGMQRYIINNKITFNKEALHFHEAIKNNTITNNNIYGNIEDVVKDVRGIPPLENIIQYNYWDRYEGFDKNKDNIGDTSHKNYQYVDQLWHYNKSVKFFYASPVMTLMNFLSNLAPFIEPVLLLEDTKPLVKIIDK